VCALLDKWFSMIKAFNILRQSPRVWPLKIWHVAPLFLPLLLGSTNIRVSPAASGLQSAVPPLPTNVLIDRELAKFRQNQALPSQVLSTFPRQSLPHHNTQKASAAHKAARTKALAAKQKPLPATPAQASLSSLTAPKPAQNLPPIPIRVAIALNAKTLTIATSDNGSITDQNGKALGQLPAQTGVAVAPLSSGGLQIGDWQTPSVVWVKPRTADGLVSLEGRWYRGTVQIVLQSDGIVAVNHVDLESYLYSVVGSEMPAFWPAEALKAQAITARSYALVHMTRHANDLLYDLGATPQWQAYNGAESETNTTQAAVNATRGILLSYKGGVVESLYASSIDIVKDVHGGYGMSQEGANQLAQKQFSYPQILGYFYPGTSLAVLNIQ
jgi:stage II sporulation protein D